MLARKYPRLTAALLGACVCALLGPALGAAALVFGGTIHELPLWTAVSTCLYLLLWDVPIAVLLFGPAAFALGTLGALGIQWMSARAPSAKILVLSVSILGLVLGAGVPLMSDLILAAFYGHLRFETDLLLLGATTGLACAMVVYTLLRRMRLLFVQQ
jgi:hypothetical protein